MRPARVFPVLAAFLLLVAFPGASPAGAQDKPADLGLEIHAAGRPVGTLMLLLSGDTGWGDLEEAVTSRANRAGIDVVGLNSRRYFFSGSTPERLAWDLQRILAYYGKQWRTRRFVLAGYSFGADALPFAWKHLPPATRRRTERIALIGLQPAANFSISIWEMLNLPAPDDIPVSSALRDLPGHKLLCIHGIEDGQACNLPVLKGATRIPRPGGHDFDGDYDAVAEATLSHLGASKHLDASKHLGRSNYTLP